jgi:RNA polymerase sigma-70 factor (ECF subfamily)
MVDWRYPLEKLAFRLLYDHGAVNDVLQETFIRIWQQRKRYDSEKPAWPWVARILRNKCYDYWRKHKSKKNSLIEASCDFMEAEYVQCPKHTPSGELEDLDFKDFVKMNVSDLSLNLREVVQLSLFSEMTDAEIACELGIPSGTVKSRKHRGIEQIKRKIKQGEGNERKKCD